MKPFFFSGFTIASVMYCILPSVILLQKKPRAGQNHLLQYTTMTSHKMKELLALSKRFGESTDWESLRAAFEQLTNEEKAELEALYIKTYIDDRISLFRPLSQAKEHPFLAALRPTYAQMLAKQTRAARYYFKAIFKGEFT